MLITIFFYLKPKVFTSTPKAVKPSEQCCSRTIQRRNNFLKKSIEFSTCSSAPKQTGLLVNSFTKIEKKSLEEETGMKEPEISAEEMMSLKAKLGIPWGKLNTMGR